MTKHAKMHPVVHFEMPAEDRKRMSAFYTRAFGWKTEQLGPEMGEYVVVTTFANTRKTLIIQGRLVRLSDGAVKTSWRYSMPLNRELLGLFQPAEAPYKIAVKGIGR